jgi:small subunit ribosomal protein S18
MSCQLCQKAIEEIDFTDADFLRQFTTETGKIKTRRKTRLCSKHQRKITKAIKRARYLGLLPYVA